MTSEIVKDHVQGVLVEVLSNGAACLEAIQKKTYDLIVIDFDLPDADGVTLSKLVRTYFDGPILITAFDDEVVQEAIKTEMFLYSDICSFIKKPIVTSDFAAKIEKYLLKKKRFQKRFETNIPLEITKGNSGKSKKSTAVKGRIINLSIAGAGIRVAAPLKGKIGDEVSLVLDFKKNSKKGEAKVSKASAHLTKIKAHLVWLDKSKKNAGFKFDALSEKTLKDLETVLRTSREID
jgi:DNA-binding response OmpR family regulator